jgi:hypothetical protein
VGFLVWLGMCRADERGEGGAGGRFCDLLQTASRTGQLLDSPQTKPGVHPVRVRKQGTPLMSSLRKLEK